MTVLSVSKPLENPRPFYTREPRRSELRTTLMYHLHLSSYTASTTVSLERKQPHKPFFPPVLFFLDLTFHHIFEQMRKNSAKWTELSKGIEVAQSTNRIFFFFTQSNEASPLIYPTGL